MIVVTDVELDPDALDRRFHVELFIVHPAMAPSVITNALGLEPEVAHSVGERRTTLQGKILPGNYPDTRWRYSKECRASDQWFASELEDLVNRLEPHKAFLESLADTGGRASVIIQFLGDGYFSDSLSPAILTKLGDLGLELGMEVYNMPQSS